MILKTIYMCHVITSIYCIERTLPFYIKKPKNKLPLEPINLFPVLIND